MCKLLQAIGRHGDGSSPSALTMKSGKYAYTKVLNSIEKLFKSGFETHISTGV